MDVFNSGFQHTAGNLQQQLQQQQQPQQWSGQQFQWDSQRLTAYPLGSGSPSGSSPSEGTPRYSGARARAGLWGTEGSTSLAMQAVGAESHAESINCSLKLDAGTWSCFQTATRRGHDNFLEHATARS